MRNRQEYIYDDNKGSYLVKPKVEFGKIKIDKRTIDDATLKITQRTYKCGSRTFKIADIYRAIDEKNLFYLRDISNFFYDTNGIYSRICDYFANMYRFDWYIVPEIYDQEKVDNDKVLKKLYFLLGFLDGSYIKKNCGDIALKVIKNGAYYGYLVPSKNGIVLQELPIAYCRSLYNSGSTPVIEFNMRYFDENFIDPEYRTKILNMFPDEFKKGYILYKQGKLPGDNIQQSTYWTGTPRWSPTYIKDGWYALEVGSAIKFAFANGDQPLFAKAIPAILDLMTSQGLDKQKQMQNLQKLLIQKYPLDKNFDLVFDLDEIKDLHDNTVEMVEDNIGVGVVSTVADVDAVNIADTSTAQSTDVLERMERGVYNAFGVSRNLFNSDTSLALEKSILDDESSLRTLLLQFTAFFDNIVQHLASNSKFKYRFYMLETTQYNYKDLSKMYKEQVQIGYSKMLPQIALGHSQSSILHNAYFENEVLNLSAIMIPPLMSSTMNAESLSSVTGGKNQKSESNQEGAGRPEKSDSEKSEKTAANLESM